MAERGGKRPGAGRPFGSKNRLPRGKNYDQFKAMVYDTELHEYIAEDVTNPYDLIKRIYRSKDVPLRYRLLAAKEAKDFEPYVKDEPETAESRAEAQREMHEMLEYFAKHAIAETIRQMSGSPGRSAAPAWINPLVTEALAKRKAIETRASELVPPAQPRVAVKKREPVVVADGNDYGSGVEEPVKAAETLEGKRKKPQLATVILHARPHQCFQALSGNRYSADERGEIRCSDRDDIESLLRSGCKAPAS
jgi:hypothetical protein